MAWKTTKPTGPNDNSTITLGSTYTDSALYIFGGQTSNLVTEYTTLEWRGMTQATAYDLVADIKAGTDDWELLDGWWENIQPKRIAGNGFNVQATKVTQDLQTLAPEE
jgi:hypothetical protein